MASFLILLLLVHNIHARNLANHDVIPMAVKQRRLRNLENTKPTIREDCNFRGTRYRIRVHPVVAANDDGTLRARITSEELRRWLNRANEIYSQAGLRFEFDGKLHPVDDSRLNYFTGFKDPNWSYAASKLNRIARNTGKLVILFRDPGGGFSWDTLDFVLMPGFGASVWGVQNIELLAHELGHYFGLKHTFAHVFRSIGEAEHAFRANGRDPEYFDGDSGTIADTPPDPFVIDVAEKDHDVPSLRLAGKTFSPQYDNIMSYYHRKPVHGVLPRRSMTKLQVRRVRTLVHRRIRKGSLRGVRKYRGRWC